jgi:hypothetical protein
VEGGGGVRGAKRLRRGGGEQKRLERTLKATLTTEKSAGTAPQRQRRHLFLNPKVTNSLTDPTPSDLQKRRPHDGGANLRGAARHGAKGRVGADARRDVFAPRDEGRSEGCVRQLQDDRRSRVKLPLERAKVVVRGYF